MIRIAVSLFFVLSIFSGAVTTGAVGLAPPSEIPVKGMVTLLDIGSEGCTPCKMMVPILRDMEERYRGKAAIIAIDTGRDRDWSRQFSPRVVPTQIFFDKEGKVVSRHEGYMDKKSMEQMLEKLGVGK